MARLGLTASEVHNTLAAALAGRDAGHIYEGNRRFDLVVKLNAGAGKEIDAVPTLPVMKADGSFVPLGTVAQLVNAKGADKRVIFSGEFDEG